MLLYNSSEKIWCSIPFDDNTEVNRIQKMFSVVDAFIQKESLIPTFPYLL
jgi:hypothetical protein